MPQAPARILVTGANGHLGRQLISRLARERESGSANVPSVRALVRSERAASQIEALGLDDPPEVVIADYGDASGLTDLLDGCEQIVHLVGILKQTSAASYEEAHERSCTALAEASERAGARRIVYLSIFGSVADSPNACLASKGRAEEILLRGAVPVTILRVPMVIGPGDFASAALRRDAQSRVVALIAGGTTMQQPIDSRDVLSAILAALKAPDRDSAALDLGGPERITQRALVERAAKLYHRTPIVVPIPMALSRGFVSMLETLLRSPPITTPMLEVLQHDDRIDEASACERLGIVLKPLDETLRSFVGPETSQS